MLVNHAASPEQNVIAWIILDMENKVIVTSSRKQLITVLVILSFVSSSVPAFTTESFIPKILLVVCQIVRVSIISVMVSGQDSPAHIVT